MNVVEYKFNPESRYLTRGINSELPLELQILLWSMIDNLLHKKTVKMDYLQVFHFELSDNDLVINHSQEIPQYKRVYKISMKDAFLPLVNRKVFVIDDIEHCTMLFSNEY